MDINEISMLAREQNISGDFADILAFAGLVAAEARAEMSDRVEQAVAPYLGDAERLDWLAQQFKTSTVYMSGEQPFRPNFKVMGLQGTSFRDAIDAARKGNT